MNSITGGVARSTPISDVAFVNLYSYTGTGLITGFLTTLEDLDKTWLIKLTVDGQEIFGLNGFSTKDLDKSSRYNFDVNKEVFDPSMGIDIQKDTFRWGGILNKPIRFKIGVVISVKRFTGESPRKFKAGLIGIHKES
jgi:hypothetical protein